MWFRENPHRKYTKIVVAALKQRPFGQVITVHPDDREAAEWAVKKGFLIWDPFGESAVALPGSEGFAGGTSVS